MARWLPSLITGNAAKEIVDELCSILADFHPRGVRTMARADLRDVVPRVKVLYGDADVRSPLNIAEQLHADIPGSTLVVLTGVGHQLNVEDPERVNAAIRQFIGSPC
ncbi:MAG: alpha/beta hydrolase [Thermoleophilia bacterium]|nr:alpha/beta hydrolase [Thermoleophilia bacterium]